MKTAGMADIQQPTKRSTKYCSRHHLNFYNRTNTFSSEKFVESKLTVLLSLTLSFISGRQNFTYLFVIKHF